MTSKTDFTDDEWTRIRRAPFVAGMAISIADPGGPIEVMKESMASVRSAAVPPSREGLLAAVADDIQELVQNRQNPVASFRPSDPAHAGRQVLDELKAVDEIVSGKATPEEERAYRRWLVATARAAADAAKEGGFLGFGAEQISSGEQKMLDELRASLGEL